MAEFVMPALGADMSAGTLLRWRKQPGEAVKRGDIIAEVHTDKADIEVEVFTGGVIEKLLVEPGTEVPTGTPLAVISEDGATAEAAAEAPAPGPHLLISPSAKHLAEELGVEPAAIAGTGPGGRIQRKDVQAAAEAKAAPEEEPTPPPAAAAMPAVPAPEAEPTAPPELPPRPPAQDRQEAMRRAIAAAMARSKREIPHFYLSQTIDLSRAMAWLGEENLRRPVAERLLPGVLLLKAVALGLLEVPELNATWQDDEVVQSDAVHLGVATFLRGGGLVAPAIHDAHLLTLEELMRRLHDLVSRARAGTLRSSEMSEPTITVTSLGERGVEGLFPIIFPPQVAIVGFGKLVERPWVSEGQILPCPVVTASLGADHRVTDGHRASALLNVVDNLLQEPEDL
jgi:pyruvate dehydrogenase E2 component (dihydrolipoyllysine-residue acetyltransferase)